jgi:hypothetical protein
MVAVPVTTEQDLHLRSMTFVNALPLAAVITNWRLWYLLQATAPGGVSNGHEPSSEKKGLMPLCCADRTRVTVTQAGSELPVVLVDGVLCHRGVGPNPRLAATLAGQQGVSTYDRRRRSDSCVTAVLGSSSSVDREAEDRLMATDAAGGRTHVCGMSSGAALSMEVARWRPCAPHGDVQAVGSTWPTTRRTSEAQ